MTTQVTSGTTKFNDSIQVYKAIEMGGDKTNTAPVQMTVEDGILKINQDIMVKIGDDKYLKFTDIAGFFDGEGEDDFKSRIEKLERKTQFIEDPGETTTQDGD